ncbi:hypothetical protein FSP39_010881 [Pinctada imbricata]|uniref:Adhesion G-protein coupled receptor D1-like n=1 Tax=Pinctada imbricata TaxID=66713 RepID=A0AA88Y031_PINIB|nr:hypothetical protein FSP39_010881 [Pinctada imbricata]
MLITQLQNFSIIIIYRQEVMPDLLYSMENVLAATSMNENINIHTPEIDLFVERVERNLSNGDKFTLSSYVGTIALPVTVFDGKTSRVSVIVYKTVNQRWSVKKGYQNAQIGSNIMSVSLQQPENNTVHKLDVNVTGAVIVVLPTNVTKREKSRLCTYWSFEKSYWDTEGGTVLQKNDTHTKCRYDHMTNFAVLVLYYNDYDPVTEEESRTLYILTALGCSVSIACLLVCLIIYVYLQVLSNDTVMIHANLSLSLMLAQLVLVTSDGASKYPHACKIVTVLLHFLFLSAFTWMLVEGVALYFSCSRAITSWGNTRIKYMVMGWGIPSVIVLVSLGATFPNYGDGLGDNCWLSIKNGLIWSFMGPLIIIVMVNLVILGLVMRAFLSLRSNSRKSEAARIRASLRAIVTLLPILGITWLFGLLVPLSDVFHYLFVIGNSTQVIIALFVYHNYH